MLFPFVLLHVEVGLLADGRSHGGMLEALPYHVDGQVGGVGHLLVEETVVAQFIEYNLVGREVVG